LDELEGTVLPQLSQQLDDLERLAPDVEDRTQRAEATAAGLERELVEKARLAARAEPKTRLGRILFRTGRWFG
jgi:hypothetical protein